MRNWDLARAAKAKKVGFWAYIAGYFFIFGFRGGAREGDSMRAWGGVRVFTGEGVRFCARIMVLRRTGGFARGAPRARNGSRGNGVFDLGMGIYFFIWCAEGVALAALFSSFERAPSVRRLNGIRDARPSHCSMGKKCHNTAPCPCSWMNGLGPTNSAFWEEAHERSASYR